MAAWVVVQQGMNGERKQARRYHWLSESLRSFVEEPHAAMMASSRARSSTLPTGGRKRLAHAARYSAIVGAGRYRARIAGVGGSGGDTRSANSQPMLPHLIMPTHHEVRPNDVLGGGCTAIWLRRQIVAPPTSASCSSFPASEHGPCVR